MVAVEIVGAVTTQVVPLTGVHGPPVDPFARIVTPVAVKSTAPGAGLTIVGGAVWSVYICVVMLLVVIIASQASALTVTIPEVWLDPLMMIWLAAL